MRMRRIHEIDLARISVLEIEDQKLRLKALKGFRPPHTLNPFRKSLADIVNIQFEMLGGTPATDWIKIANRIRSFNESPEGVVANLAVARCLYDFVCDHSVQSFSKPVSRWPVGFGNSVVYWQDFYCVWEGKAAFVYFDPRKSSPLTKMSMRFVFSMMHQRLRVDDPDFSSVDLKIFRFVDGDDGKRVIKQYSSEDFDLFDRDQLNEMVTVTYGLWATELEERVADQKRRAGGNGNPMGF